MEKRESSFNFKKQNDLDLSNHLEQYGPQNILTQKQPSAYLEQIIVIDQKIQRMLLSSKRFYKKQKWAKDILETCINTDFESTTIELHYGNYATQINFINIQYQVIEKEGNKTLIGCGQYGKVYVYKSEDGNEFAVKMIKFERKKFFSELKNIYREYFIALLASQLAIGPKLINIYGYQLLFLRNYALFGMQLGQKFGYENQSTQFYRQVGLSLQNSLKLLHSLHIVHRDIKPANIIWSNYYQRYVFIDFGLSLIIKQNPGQKTETLFTGTYNYCGHEMRKLYLLQQSGMVDLYSNDLYSIQQVAKLIGTYFNKRNLNEGKQESELSLIYLLFLVSKIKWSIFEKQFQQAHFLLTKCSMHKTALFIVNKEVQKRTISENMVGMWNQLRKELRQKIKEMKFKGSQEDENIVGILQKNSIDSIWTHLLLSLQHLQNLSEWSKNEIWLQRIFLLFNPLTSSYQTEQEQIIKIIQTTNKIYSALKLPQTAIPFKKARSVLLFFFQNFRKFKTKKVFGSLSEIFTFIRDFQSAQKVKQFILQNTQDPIQYCLKSLRYHLQDKKLYGLNNVSYIFLTKLREKLLTIQDSNDQIINLLGEIVNNMAKIDLVTFSNTEVLIQIQCLLFRLQDLVSKKRPQFCYIIEKFQKLFAQLCFLVIIELNIFNSYKKVESLQKAQLKLRNLYNKDKLLNRLDDRLPLEKERQSKLPTQNLIYYGWSYFIKDNNIIRFIEFALQLSEGEPYSAKSNIWKQVQKYFDFMDKQKILLPKQQSLKIKKITKIGNILIIKKCTQWVKKYKEYPSFLGYFNTIFLKINSIVLCFHNEMFNEDIGAIYPQKNEYQNELEIFLKEVHQIVDNVSENYQQRQILYLIVNIGQVGAMIYAKCEERKLYDAVIRISTQITQTKYSIELWKMRSDIEKMFCFTLYIIIVRSLIKNPKYVGHLQQIFLQFFDSLKDVFFLMKTGMLQQVIRIRSKTRPQQQNLNYIFGILQFLSLDEYINQELVRQKQSLCRSLCYFIELCSSEFIQQFIIKLTSKQHSDSLKRYTSSPYESFLLFQMCGRLFSKEQIFKKYFCKIALNLDKFPAYIRTYIRNRYVVFFIENKSLNERKKLIYYRKLCRDLSENKKNGVKFWGKIKIKIKNKSLKWPSIIRNAMSLKMY